MWFTFINLVNGNTCIKGKGIDLGCIFDLNPNCNYMLDKLLKSTCEIICF